MNREDIVREFHKKYGLTVNDKPSNLSLRDATLRGRLLSEELDELLAELWSPNPDFRKIAKEMADLQYVLSGLAVSVGIDLEKSFQLVHKSNMTKTGVPDQGGKILKGEGYIPPDLENIL